MAQMNLYNIDILLLDQYGNLSNVISNIASAQWEWNRVGGCGQAVIEIEQPYEQYEKYFVPNCSIQIEINNQLRYWGKLLKYKKNIQAKQDNLTLTCYGYMIELQDVIANREYKGVEIGAIVKDIMTSFVKPNSHINYNAAMVYNTGYSVYDLVLNHTAQDAFTLLAGLAGYVEWGVDYNKNFFFIATDQNIRRVFVLGREIDQYQEERDDSKVVNIINVYGQNGNYISTVSSQMSINKYGHKEQNIFESAIQFNSDANRLGAITIQTGGASQRAIKFRFIQPDVFIESGVPLGATAINLNVLNQTNKYGTHKKYGTGLKYGNLNRDQLDNIAYVLSGGGLEVTASMISDVPNIGDYQKRVSYQIKDLQRR